MPLKIRLINYVKRVARSRGYDITPLWQLEARPLVLHLRTLFKTYGIDCILDVGANLGQFYDLLRAEVDFQGPVLSFEPVRRYAEGLKARAAREPNWTVFDFALGCANESAAINVTSSPGLSSFLLPIQEDLVTHTEVVQIKTVDSIFEGLARDHNIHAPYLKLDTQGFDLEVMKGATNSIRQFRALQTEASVRPGYGGMPTYLQTIEHLSQVGFEISAMFPVWHDKALRLVEFDLVVTNRVFADTIR